jgi:hypothetical protein
MRATRLALLLLAGLGLTACVGVSGGQYRAPYGAFNGNSHLVTPYVYRGGPDGYLYDQSRRSWQGNTYRQAQPYRQQQGNARNRHNRSGHDNRRNF